MKRRPVTAILLAATCAVSTGAASACTGNLPGAAQTETETEAPDPGSPPATRGPGPAPEPASGAGSAAVVGTTRAQLRATAIDNRSVPLRIDVTHVRASGDLVDLEMVLTNEAPATGDKPPKFIADTLFGDGRSDYDLSAVGLVDPRAQKLYLPVLDSEKNCLCTRQLGATEFAAGGSYTLTATIGGLPHDVDTVDVRIPQFAAVTGVRVER